jgi:predicted GIY-YIG superfamily endonuclease
MFSDRLLARLAEQGDTPDYPRLAAEVLGIRSVPPALARTLVEQAILATDWRERWQRVGARAIEEAPHAPGVYVFRDAAGVALYVGKATNLRQRLGAHFAARKWRALPPALARVALVEWEQLGSELEALLREAALIRDLKPCVNVQTGPSSTRMVRTSLVRDVVLLLPSVGVDVVQFVAARPDGSTVMRQASRTGVDCDALATDLWSFFDQPAGSDGDAFAPLVFSWLARRGRRTTRIHPDDVDSWAEWRDRLRQLLGDKDLLVERLIVVDSGPRIRRP